MARTLEIQEFKNVEDVIASLGKTDVIIANDDIPVNTDNINVTELQNQIELLTKRLNILQGQYDSLVEQYTQAVRVNGTLNKENTILSQENANLKTQNQSLTETNKLLLDENTTLQLQLDEALLPYSNEKEALKLLNQSLASTNGQLWNLQQLIKQTGLDKNISLLLSNLDYYLVDKFNQTITTAFDSLTSQIEKQNNIENLKFDIQEQNVTGINLNNVDVYLISKTEVKKLDSKSVLKEYGTYNVIELEPSEFNELEDNYMLYFTNNNYLQQNINVRLFRFNNTFDLVVFKSLDNNIYNGTKLYLKDNTGKAYFESLIYQMITIGEHKILFVDKIQNILPETAICDILTLELEDTFIYLKYANSDIDEVQQLLIGKMEIFQDSNTTIFYDVDDVTELKRIRTYQDPQNNTIIRIPTIE